MGHFYIKGVLAFAMMAGTFLAGLGLGLVLGLKQKYIVDLEVIEE